MKNDSLLNNVNNLKETSGEYINISFDVSDGIKEIGKDVMLFAGYVIIGRLLGKHVIMPIADKVGSKILQAKNKR